MKVLGLMSGTSADGVDAALTEITGRGHTLRVTLLDFQAVPYSSHLRKTILRTAEKGTVPDVCRLHAVLGEFFAKAALKTIAHAGLLPEEVDLIGSHGQTIHHCPQPVYEPGLGMIRSTLQIGDPSIIAERTGITTVFDFRARDLAAGGEGAPLTPYIHSLVFRHSSRSRLVINLGGIANVTLLPPGGDLARIQAFDTGPCNMLLDGLAGSLSNGKYSMDRGGKLALRGNVNANLSKMLLAHPFIKRPPPKSTGREEFGSRYIQRIRRMAQRRNLASEDLLATACHFIAQTIASANRWLSEDPQEVVVGGGGVFNHALMAELKNVFQPTPVFPMEHVGSHSKAFEAEAFAVLAYQTAHGICANVPSVTGARHSVILGSLVPGKKKRT